MAEAIIYKTPKAILSEPIEWLGDKHSDIIKYLRKNGFTTMEDVIDRQNKIPNKYFNRIKAKLVFGIDM